jgi:hypothetical protein
MMKYPIIGLLLLLLVSCAEEKQSRDAEAVQTIPLNLTADAKHSAPYLFTDHQGQVYLSFISSKDGHNQLSYTQLAGEGWEDPIQIAAGNDWFVNWADYPQITSLDNNRLLSFFLQKSGEGVYSYDIKLTQSVDGKDWAAPTILHDDGKQAEHGFVSFLPYGENAFVAWLDGRNSAMDESHDGHAHHGHGGGAMTLRAAVLQPDGQKANEWELDERVCDCCQTSAAMTSNGPIVVYRDRSEEEVRNISIVRLIDGEWTAPLPVYPDNWQIPGCPVNGPRADAFENTLGVAWFTAANGRPEVKVAFSQNGGETFDNPIKINDGSTIGRVDFVMLDENRGVVSWMEGAEIKMREVYSNGTVGTSVHIATSSDQRSSGFPQMTRADENLIFAWTDEKDSLVSIQTAQIKIPG